MTFEEYQKLARTTAKYPKIGENFVYPAMGLAGESGEVLNKIKKIFRDDGGIVKDERLAEIKKELGDLLWYIAQLCTEFGVPLDEVAVDNIKKLSERFEKNKILGDGDNR